MPDSPAMLASLSTATGRVLASLRAAAAIRVLLASAVGLLLLGARLVSTPQESSACQDETRGLGKIAYVQDGDIWTKTLPDGAPTRLTFDHRSMAPSWSASGAWLTVMKNVDRGSPETWVMRADGSDARRLDARLQPPNSASGLWSPVADRLLYVNDDGDIVTETADGSDRNVAVVRDRSNSADQLGYPLWSPDGASIAYARQSRPAYESLWLYDARDGTSVELYNYLPPDGQIVPAAWSPDGSQVYFWRSPIYSASIMADGLPLWVVPSNGGEASNLGVTTLLYSHYLTVAAGGRLIVADGGGRVSLGNKRLALVDPGSAAQVLTAVEAASVAPAWSLDARQVAFVAAPDRYDIAAGLIAPMADRRIWLMDADGANQRRLLPDQELAEEGPQWSRDGASILFVRPSFLITRDQSRLEATLWLANLKDASTIPVVERLRLDMGTYSGFYYSHMDWRYLFDWWQPR